MSEFDDDLARGYLENGEPLEARYGTGYWTQMPEPEPEYELGECPHCGQAAVYCMGEFCGCDKCGKKHEDELPESEE